MCGYVSCLGAVYFRYVNELCIFSMYACARECVGVCGGAVYFQCVCARV